MGPTGAGVGRLTALDTEPTRIDVVRDASADTAIDADTLAAVAHGLLNSLTVISAAATALAGGENFLERDRSDSLYDLIQTETGFIAAILGDLVRGLPPAVVAELDAMIPPRGNSL